MSPRRRAAYPTIKDVAERAGVSKSLVSRALRGEPAVADGTRQRIVAAAAALGYRPNAGARSLAARRSNAIGFVITGLFDPFWGEVVHSIDRAAEQHGLSALYMSGAFDSGDSDMWLDRFVEYREMEAIERLLEYRIDGMGVGLGGHLDLEELEEIASVAPLVAMMIDYRSSVFDTVTVDEDTALNLAIAHLRGLGHEQIVFLGEGTRPATRARVAAYLRAMEQAAAGIDPVVYPCALLQGDGYETMRSLIEADQVPTAIVAITDGVARGAVMAFTEAGLSVPDDVSIIGYDDSMHAVAGQPLLTTIRVPRRELGATTVRLLVERRKGRSITSTVMLRPSLVVRDSTGVSTRARRNLATRP